MKRHMYYYLVLASALFFLSNCVKEDTLLILPSSGLINGGFEYGTFSGWETQGYVYVASKLDTLLAFEGKYMGVISTSKIDQNGYIQPDNNTYHANNYIKQRFKINEQHQILNFRWRFLSENLPVHIGQDPQDYFSVSIINQNEDEQMLMHMNTDIMVHRYGNLPVDFGELLPISDEIFENGFATDWQEAQINIAAFQNKMITLRFEAVAKEESSDRIIVVLDQIDILK